MSVHVLLNLLNELGKRDKMLGLSSILSIFRNEFNKFYNIRARMLDSIYHNDIKNTLKSHFWCKAVIIFRYIRSVVIDVITFPVNMSTSSGLSILLNGIISLQDARRHMINANILIREFYYFFSVTVICKSMSFS